MDRQIEQLVHQHAPAVLAYLFAIVRDRDLADDLLQETFLVACRHRRRLGEIDNPGGWLRTVARHQAFRALRQRNAHVPADWGEVDGESVFERADPPDVDLVALLKSCRADLPDQQREVIRLFYDARQPAEQVAEQLGLAVKTVYQTLWRARESLRQCVERKTRSSEMNR